VKRLEPYASIFLPSLRSATYPVQENGVATAIEAIYRDLEYARSLVKRTNSNEEESTPTSKDEDSPPSGSGYSSSGSAHRSPSEEWSVISEQDDRRSSMGSQHSDGKLTRDCSAKRTSFTAAVLSVLPDSFTAGSPRSRRRSLSAS
jgi:hypothetical protein